MRLLLAAAAALALGSSTAVAAPMKHHETHHPRTTARVTPGKRGADFGPAAGFFAPQRAAPAGTLPDTYRQQLPDTYEQQSG
jgi:hypothetical protein